MPRHQSKTTAGTLLLGVLVALLHQPAVAFAQEKAGPPPGGGPEVEEYLDLSYTPEDPDPKRRLDIFRPRGKEGAPVLFFVHGGAWVVGSKEGFLGIPRYRDVGRTLARQGIVTVLPNYRLSPRVRHPEHIRDIARAFAWTRRNVARYGGRVDQLFVGGHSAGGHLSALLTTDARYLRAEGLDPSAIRGVLAISGVYNVDGLMLKLWPEKDGKVSAALHPFFLVFGSDLEAARDASPLRHVRPGLPPFLLVYAGIDLPPLPGMAREFEAALEKCGCAVESLEVPLRTHRSVLFDWKHGIDPTTLRAMLAFLERHAY